MEKKKVQYIAWKDTGLWRENSWLKRYIWESNKKVRRGKMNIYEASKKALQEKKCMRENPTARVKVKVETAGTCTLMKLDGSHPVKGWQPTTRELLSESWEITE